MDVRTAQRLADALHLEPSLAAEFIAALTASRPEDAEYATQVRMRAEVNPDSRVYSGCAGVFTTAQYPEPPLATTGVNAVLILDNPSTDTEGGCALLVSSGNIVGRGNNWLVKHAQVLATTRVTDGRREELLGVSGLGSQVTSTYYALDCLEVADSKGRPKLGAKNLRVFQQSTTFPVVNEVVPYLHDTTGLAWRLNANDAPDPLTTTQLLTCVPRMRAGVATSSWMWLNTAHVWGLVTVNPYSEYGPWTSGPDTSTTVTVYLHARAAEDPNVQKSEIVYYFERPVDSQAYGLDCYDEKIGSLKMWRGGLTSVPGGWELCTAMSGLFPVGLATSGTYGTDGDTGGSSTVSIGSHWVVGTYPTNSKDLHLVASGGTVPTGSVSGSGLHTHAKAAFECLTCRTHRHTIPDDTFTKFQSGTDYWVPNAWSGYEGSHLHTIQVNVNSGTHSHTFSGNSHSHEVDFGTHSHNVNLDFRSDLVHTNAYGESTIDNRPPYRVVCFIERIGPNH